MAAPYGGRRAGEERNEFAPPFTSPAATIKPAQRRELAGLRGVNHHTTDR